jgi:hypothetical protein
VLQVLLPVAPSGKDGITFTGSWKHPVDRGRHYREISRLKQGKAWQMPVDQRSLRYSFNLEMLPLAINSRRLWRRYMAIELDHTIVPSHHQIESARLLAELLGVPWSESGAGPFSPVYVNDGLTLDFIETDEPFPI